MDTIGANVKTISTTFLLNNYYSNQYYFAGTPNNDIYNNGWSRVKEESLINRNKDSTWCDDDDLGGVGKGIKMKYMCGDSTARFIYSICIIVSSLSKEEFPSNDFIVVSV